MSCGATHFSVHRKCTSLVSSSLLDHQPEALTTMWLEMAWLERHCNQWAHLSIDFNSFAVMFLRQASPQCNPRKWLERISKFCPNTSRLLWSNQLYLASGLWSGCSSFVCFVQMIKMLNISVTHVLKILHLVYDTSCIWYFYFHHIDDSCRERGVLWHLPD